MQSQHIIRNLSVSNKVKSINVNQVVFIFNLMNHLMKIEKFQLRISESHKLSVRQSKLKAKTILNT